MDGSADKAIRRFVWLIVEMVLESSLQNFVMMVTKLIIKDARLTVQDRLTVGTAEGAHDLDLIVVLQFAETKKLS